ncbi:MAG: hypothetical protein Q3Y08_06255 [Butyricicoccus sp.]|nr:hypothetical protein [Butyricicoccus sp.]
MTVRQLYTLSSNLIYEAPFDDEDLSGAFPHILNQAIAESLDYENQFRRLEGQTLLKIEDVPLYDSAEDTSELPLHEILCRGALPLGIKAALLEEDGSRQAEAVLAYNKFVAALMDLTPAVFIETVGDEDT